MDPIKLSTVLMAGFLAISSAGASAQTPDEIRALQHRLANYGVKSATGRLDAATRAAIEAYQRDWHLEVSGEIDQDLMDRMARRHPDTKPQWRTVANQACKVWNARPVAQEIITWDGQCVDGVAQGRGKLQLTWQYRGRRLGISFDGEYRNGRANGLGTITYSNGDRFAGHFENGKRHGEGVFAWVGGTYYKGQFENGLRHGLGLVVFPKGDRYEGQWQHGKPHGAGTFTTSDGVAEKREWRNGCSMLNGSLRWLFVRQQDCRS
ncbi:MAG: peptidoglycan-binding protein [Pseudomonadota bacterium]